MGLELELEPSLTILDLESSWRGPELERSLASLGVVLELLRQNLTPLELSLVADLVPDLEEVWLGDFPDQQSDTYCMNMNSSR